MAEIRRIWGPFVTRPRRKPAEVNAGELRWHFFGIRRDGTVARWQLLFKAEDRSFQANNLEMRWAGSSEVTEPNLFLPHIDSHRYEEGRMVDLLRSRLRPEHLAEAAAVALSHKPKVK